MERFAFPASGSSQTTISGPNVTSNNPNLHDDPFSIELERLDVLDLSVNNIFMNEVIDFKKSLLDDAKLMCKLFSLDQLSSENDTPQINKIRKSRIKKSTRHYEDDDEEQNEPVDSQIEDIKNEEEFSDENEEDNQIDDLEEDNDYMESYFDNGEDYIE